MRVATIPSSSAKMPVSMCRPVSMCQCVSVSMPVSAGCQPNAPLSLVCIGMSRGFECCCLFALTMPAAMMAAAVSQLNARANVIQNVVFIAHPLINACLLVAGADLRQARPISFAALVHEANSAMFLGLSIPAYQTGASTLIVRPLAFGAVLRISMRIHQHDRRLSYRTQSPLVRISDLPSARLLALRCAHSIRVRVGPALQGYGLLRVLLGFRLSLDSERLHCNPHPCCPSFAPMGLLRLSLDQHEHTLRRRALR
jgi:hypothetical protein